jgi:hypothetical protein
MYAFSVAGQKDRRFQVRQPVVAFAGSRRGSLPDSVTVPFVHAFHALDFSLLNGCAPGINACYRRGMATEPLGQQSLVACAFESRSHRAEASGLFGIPVVPSGLSPAAALQRRTDWMVCHCGLLVFFPADPVFGRWGKG